MSPKRRDLWPNTYKIQVLLSCNLQDEALNQMSSQNSIIYFNFSGSIDVQALFWKNVN